MKVRVTLDIAGRHIDEIVTADGPDEILALAKARVESELGWKGWFLKAFTPLGFAQEVVRRYNASTDSHYDIPQTCEEFLRLGVDLEYIHPVPEETTA